MFHHLKLMLRSLAHSRGEIHTWTTGNMCQTVENVFGQMGHGVNDPLLFYTESCPEGTYLTGVMSESEITAKNLAKNLENGPQDNHLSGD